MQTLTHSLTHPSTHTWSHHTNQVVQAVLQQRCCRQSNTAGLPAYLGTGSGLGARFLVMLGLMALRALTGASALAAVPIWVAKDAYCTA